MSLLRQRRAAAAALALLLAGCAGSGTRVTLLPQQDGRASAVVVHSKAGGAAAQWLDQPYHEALVKGAAVAVSSANAVDVHERYATLFALAPPQPQRFLLYFDSGDTLLLPESVAALREAVALARERSGADVVVHGHTDTVGPGRTNDALSLRRAQRVRQMFVAQGFPPERIEVVGYGEREPAVATGDGVKEQRNRRVSVTVR